MMAEEALGEFRRGRGQLIACVILLTSNALLVSAYSVLSAPLAAEFHPSRTMLMIAMTLLSAMTALLSPLLGGVMDRAPLRWVIVTGVGAMALGFFALSLCQSFTGILIVYATLFPVANVLAGAIATSVVIGRWFDQRRGAAFGLAASGIALGGFVFPPLAAALLQHLAWRPAFQVIAVIVLVYLLPTALTIRDGPVARPIPVEPGLTIPTPPQAAQGSRRDILTHPGFWLAVLVFSVVLAGMKGLVTNMSPLALDHRATAIQAAGAISAYSAAGILAKLVFAGIADRLPAKGIYAISLLGYALGMVLVSAAPGPALLYVGVMVVGFFGGFMVPMQGLMMTNLFGGHVLGRALGLLNGLVLCALLITPPLFGAAFDHFGSYGVALQGFAILAMLTLVLLAVRKSDRVQRRGVQPT